MVELYALEIGLAVLVTVALVVTVRLCAPLRTRPCRWQRMREHDRSSFAGWHCSRCGLDACSLDGQAPKECKRTLRTAI